MLEKFELCLVLGGVLGVLLPIGRSRGLPIRSWYSGVWQLMIFVGSLIVTIVTFILLFAETVESENVPRKNVLLVDRVRY